METEEQYSTPRGLWVHKEQSTTTTRPQSQPGPRLGAGGILLLLNEAGGALSSLWDNNSKTLWQHGSNRVDWSDAQNDH